MSGNSNWQGFWSYVHADDKAEGGRIVRLANDLKAQFEMLTGEPLSLFLDKDAIKWGDGWKDKVDSSLETVAFFIAVLSPRFFMSAECRRELQYFAREATRLGIKNLVLPLLYVDVPQLNEPESKDELANLVKSFQWEDWRDLRFADVNSEAYRRAVSRLASRLAEANNEAEQLKHTSTAASTGDSNEDNSPGSLDKLAIGEETMPKLGQTIVEISRQIQLMSDILRDGTADMHHNDAVGGKGFSSRIAVARKVAQALAAPAEAIWSLGNDFASQLHSVDGGIRTIIEQAPDFAARSGESLQSLCGLFSSLHAMANSANGALDKTQTMLDSMLPLEGMSRDLRPVLRRIRQGLTRMIEGREVMNEWTKLIERAGINCK